MSKKCDLCGRGPHTTTSRSHSHIASKRKVQINLQAKTIDGDRQRVCTKCIKTMAKA
jgi:large subunit ribosomal protein L28